MQNLLVKTLLALGLGALAALVAGLVLGPAWGWALLALWFAALLANHLRHLRSLMRWVQGPAQGSVPEGAGVWRDAFTLLYQRQRAEIRRRRHLARSLARSRQAGRALPYGVAILDALHRIVWCNDSCETHFKIDAKADAGQPFTNLVRQPEFVQYVLGGDFSVPLELKRAQSDGLILSVQVVPYVDSQWLLLSRDVTQGARLETMRRDFVANVSHELRTPLTVLVGFLETLQELSLDRQQSAGYLKMMSEQGERMQRIIGDLLTLSTLESAPAPPPEERIDVSALMQRLQREAELLSSGSHRIALDADAGFDLLGSEQELASAFTNLISNAIRYTPLGGTVRLVWQAAAAGAFFTVEDSGIGVEAEHIPRLTERFYRVDRSRSRETGGTGLGLAIVKHALARHQATLEIESEVGKGSRFTVKFPSQRLVPVRMRVADHTTA